MVRRRRFPVRKKNDLNEIQKDRTQSVRSFFNAFFMIDLANLFCDGEEMRI